MDVSRLDHFWVPSCIHSCFHLQEASQTNMSIQGLSVRAQGTSFSLRTKGLREPINVFQASVLSFSAYIPLANMSHMSKHTAQRQEVHTAMREKELPGISRCHPVGATGVLDSFTLALALGDFGVSDLQYFLLGPAHYSLSDSLSAPASSW